MLYVQNVVCVDAIKCAIFRNFSAVFFVTRDYVTLCILLCMLVCIDYVHCVSKKRPPFYFDNNSAKNQQITIIFGTQHHYMLQCS